MTMLQATARPRLRVFPHRRWRRHGRRGSAVVEAIFVLPILILVTFATIQFGLILLVQQAVTHAATVGAREAAKGADADELACVINAVLAPHGLRIGDCAGVVLEDPAALNPIERRGLATCQPCDSPALGPQAIRVTVCVRMDKKPFLNPLAYFGISLAGKTMRASAVTHREFTGPAPITRRPGCGCS